MLLRREGFGSAGRQGGRPVSGPGETMGWGASAPQWAHERSEAGNTLGRGMAGKVSGTLSLTNPKESRQE